MLADQFTTFSYMSLFNEEQAQELHKPVIKKIKRRKVWQLCHKGPKVGAGDRVRITKYKKITSKA